MRKAVDFRNMAYNVKKKVNDQTDAAVHTLSQKHANMVVTVNTV